MLCKLGCLGVVLAATRRDDWCSRSKGSLTLAYGNAAEQWCAKRLAASHHRDATGAWIQISGELNWNVLVYATRRQLSKARRSNEVFENDRKYSDGEDE